VELDPAKGEKPQPYAHEGEEYGIVIRGRVEVVVEGSTYVVGPDDSIFFHATALHYVVNAGWRTAVRIWDIALPTY
jgi:quercetin dioxygenase-like cupin family protein